jgi:hypothetical protein
MADYFIKRLLRQEMGSPTLKSDGTYQFHRGRYMLIPKEFYSFFPHLTTTVLNDSTALPIVAEHTDEVIYAQYVYHNSKHIDTAHVEGQPRDESRIYLNAQLDNGKTLFMPGDIIVMMKCMDNDIPFYILHIFTPISKYYAFWNSKLKDSTYTIWSGENAPTFDKTFYLPNKSANIIGNKKVEQAVNTQQQQVIDTINNPSIETSMGADLFNSRTFHDFVMMAYGGKCAVTRRVISCNGFDNLEAAHIMPQAHNGSFLPCNGIAMSRDMHCVFDKGFFTIEDDYTIIIHPDVLQTESYINEYNGKKIFVPEVEYFRPLPKFLQHHRDNVYGSFRQIRSNWIQNI